MRQQAIRTLGLAVAAALLVLAPTAAPASATPKRTVVFKPAKTSTKMVTFRVRGVNPRRVVRASLVRDGRVRRRIGRATARQVARRGILRVELRSGRARHGHRRMGRIMASSSQRRGVIWVRPGARSVKLKVVTAAAPMRAGAEPPAAPAAGERAMTRPVGAAVLSDAEAAARVRRSGWEPRPGNAAANQRTPEPGELDTFLADNISVYRAHKPLVTGNFTGTTDEIIQWAAHKWGLDEDILRAVVVKESWWRTQAVGDNGLSFGLTQIKVTYHAGTHPLSAASTAFNVDYYGALFRYYYDGHADWLDEMDKGQDYAAGDLWGAIGAHYAGRWHTPAADGYIASVQRHLDQRTWTTQDF